MEERHARIAVTLELQSMNALQYRVNSFWTGVKRFLDGFSFSQGDVFAKPIAWVTLHWLRGTLIAHLSVMNNIANHESTRFD